MRYAFLAARARARTETVSDERNFISTALLSFTGSRAMINGVSMLNRDDKGAVSRRVRYLKEKALHAAISSFPISIAKCIKCRSRNF